MALFFDKSSSQYYLLVDNIWLSSGDLHGPWSRVTKLSKAFDKLPDSGKFATAKKAIPPPAVSNPIIPQVCYSTVPAEVILFDGQPTYSAIPGTQLVYANNTDSPVFVYSATQAYYYLAAGRWFSAPSLTGPWTFASLNLPTDFADIPLSSPASAILASVPGTSEAKDAVLIAQIPTTMLLTPTTAAAQAKGMYTGEPQFAPIEGTTLQYATNTPDKVIQVGDVYYLCLQGVWFMSTSALGPWTTASSVPQVIYTIPPSSPVYNVTYVTQVKTSSGAVQSSYTAGYLGAFVMGAAVGAIVTSGTGYYYPPYVGYPAYGYPIYHPLSHAVWCLWSVRQHGLLSHGNRSIRGIADSVRTLWLGDSHGVLQPLYRNIDANRFDIDGLWQTECGPGVQPVHRIVWRNSSRIEPHGAMGTIVRLSRKQIRHDTALFNGEWNGGFGPGVARWKRLRVIQRVWKQVRGEELEWRHVRRTRRECVPKHRFWMAEIEWECRSSRTSSTICAY